MWKFSEILKSYIYERKTKNSLRLKSQMYKKFWIFCQIQAMNFQE